MIKEIENSDYSGKVLKGHCPEKIPSGHTAAYWACKHGALEVYMFGMDLYGVSGNKFNNIYKDTKNYLKSHEDQTATVSWIDFWVDVFKMFPKVKFVRVGNDSTPDKFLSLRNFEAWSWSQFEESICNWER